MDEDVLTEYIKNNKDILFKICWSNILCNHEYRGDSHQEYYLDKWQWNDGKMMDVTNGKEVMYLHFINWKRTMKKCEINYDDNPTQFYISYTGMHYKLHSKLLHFFNTIKNFFNGYWVKENRRYRKLKIKSFIKRVKRKLNINY